jgi:hypothetical protein
MAFRTFDDLFEFDLAEVGDLTGYGGILPKVEVTSSQT